MKTRPPFRCIITDVEDKENPQVVEIKWFPTRDQAERYARAILAVPGNEILSASIVDTRDEK